MTEEIFRLTGDGEIPEGVPFIPLTSYQDNRGWKFRVKTGLDENTCKAFYQKAEYSGSASWHGVRSLPWRESFYEAQKDLDEYAKKKKMAPTVLKDEEIHGRRILLVKEEEE